MEDTAVTVSGRRDVGPDAIALDFSTPAGFDARPGQFVKLVVTIDGTEESRFYTISSPRVGETFELTVGVDPDGDVSPYLRGIEAGDEVILSGPYGNAYYENEAGTCLVAGGPGIGPAVGIAERTLDDGGDAAVVYRDDAPIHESRLAALRDRDAFVAVLSRGDPLEGAIREALDSIHLDGDGEPQVFVYGFAGFLDDAIGVLSAAGAEPDQAKVENFG